MEKNTALCFVAYRGDLQTLLDAFKRGVPVDITDKFMKTPLMVGKSSVHWSFSFIDLAFVLSLCSW